MTRTALRRCRGALARLRHDESGYAGTVIALPIVVIFVLALFQFGFYYLAGEVAQSAAYNAFQQARSYQATDADGIAAGNAALDANAGLLRDPSIHVEHPSADRVSVEITGQPFALLPFLPMPPVTRTLTGPQERWVP